MLSRRSWSDDPASPQGRQTSRRLQAPQCVGSRASAFLFLFGTSRGTIVKRRLLPVGTSASCGPDLIDGSLGRLTGGRGSARPGEVPGCPRWRGVSWGPFFPPRGNGPIGPSLILRLGKGRAAALGKFLAAG